MDVRRPRSASIKRYRDFALKGISQYEFSIVDGCSGIGVSRLGFSSRCSKKLHNERHNPRVWNPAPFGLQARDKLGAMLYAIVRSLSFQGFKAAGPVRHRFYKQCLLLLTVVCTRCSVIVPQAPWWIRCTDNWPLRGVNQRHLIGSCRSSVDCDFGSFILRWYFKACVPN